MSNKYLEKIAQKLEKEADLVSAAKKGMAVLKKPQGGAIMSPKNSPVLATAKKIADWVKVQG